MTTRTQTAPIAGFVPYSGTAGMTEVKKTLGEAIDAGLRTLSSGVRNARVTYSVQPMPDGSFQIVVAKVAGKTPVAKGKAYARSKPAATDIESALDAARQRGAVTVASILTGPGMLSAEDFAATLGIKRQSLHARLEKNQVLGLEGAKRGFRFPIWQIGADGKPFAALPALLQALDGPWAVYRFLMQFQPQLDMTGLEALRHGRDKEAIALAENLERSGA